MTDNPRPFLEHLEELRSRIIKSLAATAVCTAIAYNFTDPVIVFLSKPVGKFIFLHPTEAFFIRLKISLCLGALAAAPYILFQIWKFVVAALEPSSRNRIFWLLPISYFLFITGFAFGLFVLVPVGVKFLLGYKSDVLSPLISIGTYVNFVGGLCLVLGIVFQMPLVSFFIAKLGIIDAEWLSGKRRIAILVIYILSALLTPGPDPVTAILLAIPTYILYELSVIACRMARK